MIMKRLLQVCFIAAMLFGLAACDKDDNNIDTQKSLVGTRWTFNDGDANVTVSFPTATDVAVTVQTPHGTENHQGTYDYNEGSGVINLTVNGTAYTIPITVSGSTMTCENTPSGTVTLTLAGSNGNPRPSGDYPLNGTSWQCNFQEMGIYVTLSVTFGKTNCLFVYSDSEGDSEQSNGTYTYSGTLTSGQGTLTIQDDEDGPQTSTFTVNGNQATVTAGGQSHTFTRVI